MGTGRATRISDIVAVVRRLHPELGIERRSVEEAEYSRADISRFTQCDAKYCAQPYIVTNQPRTVGIRFGQKF